jgi:hypothetical protein
MRWKNYQRSLMLYALSFLLTLTVGGNFALADKDKLTADEVIAKHLDSIGTADVRAANKSHLIIGTVVSTLRIGGSGQINGSAVLASMDDKNLMGVDYGQAIYPYDHMAFNGKNLSVKEITPGHYSALGGFMRKYEMPFKEGLMTGELSTAWPLYHPEGRKFKYAGTKKIDGRECYVLKYESKNSNGLETSLYFDAETFHHLRTEYERKQAQASPILGTTQKQGNSYDKITEDFSDFRAEGGLTLPHTYKFQVSVQSSSDAYLQDWDFTLTKFIFNRPMSDAEFDVNAGFQKP